MYIFRIADVYVGLRVYRLLPRRSEQRHGRECARDPFQVRVGRAQGAERSKERVELCFDSVVRVARRAGFGACGFRARATVPTCSTTSFLPVVRLRSYHKCDPSQVRVGRREARNASSSASIPSLASPPAALNFK